MSEDPLAIFEILGWDLKKDGTQLLCECPFCGKEKMYVDPKKTTFDCKVCGTSGNSVTVIERMFTKVYRPALSPTHVAKLAAYRKMPEKMFKLDPNIGWDNASQRIVFIVRKPNGMPVALRTWKPPPSNSQKVAIRNLKGTKLGFLGGEQLGDKARKDEPVYITEGEWDSCALRKLLADMGEEGIVVALPGATTFPQEYVTAFQGRDVVALYDNDDPGRQGTTRCYGKLRNVAGRLRFLHWDDAKKDGYDIHDLVRDNLKEPKKAWEYLNKLLKVEPTGEKTGAATGLLVEDKNRYDEQKDIEPIGVAELHEVFKRWLKLDNCDLLDVTMAAFWSLYLPGNPLWMFIVAPPSGSKSETIMPMSAWYRCHALSNVTSKSLISGFQLQGGGDPSLFCALNGKKAVITIKDLTPLLQGSQDERDEVFGILRDAYDGSISKIFGNGIRRTYENLHFVLLAGVTPAIDAHGSTSMGERFLKFRADRDTHRDDDIDRAIRAVQNCGQEDEMRAELKEACVRALARPFEQESVPLPTAEFQEFVSKIAYICANIRAVAPTERGTDFQTMAPMVEAPPRLAIQLSKFAQGLALHLELNDLMDPRITRLVRRVALHTPDSLTTKVVGGMYSWRKKEEWMSMRDVWTAVTGVSKETVTRVVQRLCRTGMITTRLVDKFFDYKITDSFFDLLQETRFFEDLPKSDPYWRARKFVFPKKEES